MHAWNYSRILAQLLFLLSLYNARHTASWESCPTDSNFTTNSTYHSNLNLLLPSLTSATVSSGFANRSAGSSPDQVFGQALCQLDVSQDKCQACLATAVDTLRSRCPSAKDAATWGDHCFLAYSNTTFSNDSDKSSFQQILVNTAEVWEPSRFVNLVEELMNALINWAAYKTDSMFAIGQANFTSLTDLYGLVQCTRDQSDDDCFQCLRQSLASMQSCCWRNQGGVALKYKCFLRYETYSYYNMSVPTSPLPALSAAFSSAPPPGATANPPPPPAVVDSNSSSSSARDADVGGAKSQKANSVLFDLETLKVATNNFSDANKLGEGGFGPVYKGVLSDGQEVAVKRLARSSQQGFAELRNEVAFVAKLQHRNLVRLIGFCSAEEKLPVYEFLPNTSLDKILFDPTKCGQLNWERRYKIIEGIARGLLYLHEDSRLRIIHRDLKPGNILLDQHMNPKISDFGLSKLLVDQDRSKESASRIVGTNGYIAPGYALHRHFSDKSDVYSFGVLVLEIITGRRISEFRGSGHRANLQSYAWKYWNKGKALHIVDQNLCGRFQREEAFRCIRMALLCVQENPSKRPTTASVVLMLSSSSMTTPSPSAPGFLIERSRTADSNESTGNSSPEIKNDREGSSISINVVSITAMEPRQ
ncbi:receptor-like protein kinase [Musa troglodytarum]|uniref:Receptor-like protein kinase n=1 Tax=Musa troglodytarum TaxID=320322 RepID=A0A9E7HB31_9LILI|nr:receptor-like protein kinase [Musa troglodytarum]